jgi:hypothetical protein
MIAVAVSILFAAPVLAADNTPQPRGPGANFEQRKSEILKRIDDRIARNQEEKGCVQAAKNHDDLKACREKFKAEVQEQRQRQR